MFDSPLSRAMYDYAVASGMEDFGTDEENAFTAGWEAALLALDGPLYALKEESERVIRHVGELAG